MRRPASALAFATLALLAACGPAHDDGAAAAPSSSVAGSGTPSTSGSAAPGTSGSSPASSSGASSPAPSSGASSPSSSGSSPAPGAPDAPAAVPAVACGGGQTVDVRDASGLKRALEQAQPGQVIRLAPGRYEGSFSAATQATAQAPIRLCGDRSAVLDGGSIGGGYTLHLDHTTHWQVDGLTVTGGQKGVMVDGGVANVLSNLLVTSTGDEAIHLRAGSTDNLVVGNTVRDTGKRKPKFGEGVYVGTAHSNWCQISKCQPDRSDRNVIQGNDISGTTAEAVDIKEGTTDGVLRGNQLDGSGMTASDSLVDVKGNGWRVEDNTGTAAPKDAFQVHEVVDGWGRDTVFDDNTADDLRGMLVNVAGPKAIRATTVVACDNKAPGAGGGLSNVSCAGAG